MAAAPDVKNFLRGKASMARPVKSQGGISEAPGAPLRMVTVPLAWNSHRRGGLQVEEEWAEASDSS